MPDEFLISSIVLEELLSARLLIVLSVLEEVVEEEDISAHSHDSRKEVIGKSTLNGLERIITTPIGSPEYRS